MTKSKDKYVTITKTSEGKILLTNSLNMDQDEMWGLIKVGETLLRVGFINNIPYSPVLYEDFNA